LVDDAKRSLAALSQYNLDNFFFLAQI